MTNICCRICQLKKEPQISHHVPSDGYPIRYNMKEQKCAHLCTQKLQRSSFCFCFVSLCVCQQLKFIWTPSGKISKQHAEIKSECAVTGWLLVTGLVWEMEGGGSSLSGSAPWRLKFRKNLETFPLTLSCDISPYLAVSNTIRLSFNYLISFSCHCSLSQLLCFCSSNVFCPCAHLILSCKLIH